MTESNLDLIDLAHGARLELVCRQGRLVVRGSKRVDPELVARLLASKTEMLRHLVRPTANEWDAWVERAAIAEYDGHQSRAEAETQNPADLPPTFRRPFPKVGISILRQNKGILTKPPTLPTFGGP